MSQIYFKNVSNVSLLAVFFKCHGYEIQKETVVCFALSSSCPEFRAEFLPDITTVSC